MPLIESVRDAEGRSFSAVAAGITMPVAVSITLPEPASSTLILLLARPGPEYRDTGDYIFKFSLMGGDIVLYSSIRIAIMLPGSAPNLCIGFVLSRQTRDFRRLWGAADF